MAKSKGCKFCNLIFTEETKSLFPIEKHRLKNGTYKEHYRISRCKSCSSKRGIDFTNENRLFIKKLKETSPCKDCGKSYPYYVMHFDHLRDKKFHIDSKTSIKRKSLLEEIEKCEIVCANCHAERTYKRKMK